MDTIGAVLIGLNSFGGGSAVRVIPGQDGPLYPPPAQVLIPMIRPLPTPPSRQDPNNFPARGDSFLGALPNFVTDSNQQAAAVDEAQAATYAFMLQAQAAAAAAAANVNHPSYTGSSITSLSIGTGGKTIATQSGKNWAPGMVLRLYAGPGAEMAGIVTAYNGTELLLNVTDTLGAGTFASWVISVLPSLNGLTTDHVLNALGYTPVASNGSNAVAGSTWNINIHGNAGTVTTIRRDQVVNALGYTPPQPNGAGVTVGSTWQIHITGTAQGVPWAGVSGRPTAVSAFANDTGYITSAGRAFPRRSDGTDLNFNWAGQGGQPTWIWGGNDGVNMYVYNPLNWSVNYATRAGSAGSADAVAWGNVAGRPSNVSAFANDVGYAGAQWVIDNFFNVCDTVSTLAGYVYNGGGNVIVSASLQDLGGRIRLNIGYLQGIDSGNG